ncbi:O-acyltransferase WSD1-like [Carica papaya]|uniref:O-acyltransferase WSD1-like n=1 Tax=Carica papaya TaxID=3649 RepID=UPI000B8CD597|nr:O-acyltransferase WSD1-like [Carica papaya]
MAKEMGRDDFETKRSGLRELRVRKQEQNEKEEEELPVSPLGQYLNSSILSISVITVLELEVEIDHTRAVPCLRQLFLPINPRFSSIMVEDINGVKRWKKVEVNLEEHVYIPSFSYGKSAEFYEDCLRDYLTKLAGEELQSTRPLWELHIIKYPTTNAPNTLIFKLHHSLGDGYSLMGALFSSLRRADDPSLPITFPYVRMRSNSTLDPPTHYFNTFIPNFFYSFVNTISDFVESIIKSKFKKDDITPLRSAHPHLHPMIITTIPFSLLHIKQIKDILGATVNDVITGVILLGCRLYVQELEPTPSTKTDSTALVLLNTRMTRSYKSVKEMIKNGTDSPWGNHFAFLCVPIPHLQDASDNRLEYIRQVRKIIAGKRSSSAVYLTAWLLEAVKRIRGPEAASKYVYDTLKNSSMCITNMVGPKEKMALADYPIKGLYFMPVGSPQSLMISIMSYNGEPRVGVGAEKGYIDLDKFKSCIQKAFEIILQAAIS